MQLWRDGQTWVRGESQGGQMGIGGRGPVRKGRAIAVCLAGLVLVLGLLFAPALVAELRLRSLQQPATLGPLVVEPTEVHGVPFLQVAGSRPPIYSGEGVPLEKVEWAREGVRIAWQEAPRITGLRQLGDESPLFLFADRDQYLAHGRKL